LGDLTHITLAGTFMAGLGFGLASLLAFANRKLHVYEDPRIDEVEELLPHANCGACGTPGCRPFAEMVVDGSIEPARCTVNSEEMTHAIADFLGVDAGSQERQVARLACGGGTQVARFRARYEGMKSCRAAAIVSGGGKGCSWGCLGLSDCEVVCTFDAIFMNRHGLPEVITDKCTACGDCVDVCPKDLFSLQPVSRRLWVACRNLAEGDSAEADCEVACTACGRCAMDAPDGLIRIENHLAAIDYAANDLATSLPIERCPTGAIVWLDAVRGPKKGREAKRIVRTEALPLG